MESQKLLQDEDMKVFSRLRMSNNVKMKIGLKFPQIHLEKSKFKRIGIRKKIALKMDSDLDS
jgi:hypothetical protein